MVTVAASVSVTSPVATSAPVSRIIFPDHIPELGLINPSWTSKVSVSSTSKSPLINTFNDWSSRVFPPALKSPENNTGLAVSISKSFWKSKGPSLSVAVSSTRLYATVYPTPRSTSLVAEIVKP